MELINPVQIYKRLWANRALVIQLTTRDIQSRYKGSLLGLFWSFLTPVLMLSIYTFVFSVVFEARWGTGSGSKVEFALVLFCGLNTFTMLSDAVGRSTTVILSNVNYVKKVVFPLEVLPLALVGSAIFNGAVGYLVLLVGMATLMGTLHWTAIFLPIVLLPLLIMALGVTWFFASTGVYIRDMGQVVGVCLNVLMFLSPIFYPLSAIPAELQGIYYLNPITYVVEDVRRVMVWGLMPDWGVWVIELMVGLVVLVCGFTWFQKTREGFPDVI
ncbi:ABC transporter permease [Heliobacterium gestii]|uniref:Transport permease protein n=2 Tax=Heliomicrobium gestii TaxID=2699 RepID=A0A845LF94_HELGE|nr:ABC transporter permease [Heliomicrobium gestii]